MMALFFAIGVGLYYYLQPTTETLASDLTVDVLIQDQRMEPPRVTVGKGTNITLQVRSDEEGTLTVEDYNISTPTAIGRAVEITVPAQRAGVFPVVLRSSREPNMRVEVGTLEVIAPKTRGW